MQFTKQFIAASVAFFAASALAQKPDCIGVDCPHGGPPRPSPEDKRVGFPAQHGPDLHAVDHPDQHHQQDGPPGRWNQGPQQQQQHGNGWNQPGYYRGAHGPFQRRDGPNGSFNQGPPHGDWHQGPPPPPQGGWHQGSPQGGWHQGPPHNDWNQPGNYRGPHGPFQRRDGPHGNSRQGPPHDDWHQGPPPQGDWNHQDWNNDNYQGDWHHQNDWNQGPSRGWNQGGNNEPHDGQRGPHAGPGSQDNHGPHGPKMAQATTK